jgi:EAL domain-containing protein (putative c-di-GMP-specific phosphodiesterase class I)
LLDEVVVYDEDMMAHNEAQRALAVELDRALKKEEFELYFQPKYSLKGKCFYGAESLIRWHHPTRGLLPPSLFIPFAEASGNIMAIDYYVFEHVCRRIAEWKKQGNPLLYISVNLSRKTVYNPGLLDYFRSMIERYQVDPRMIEIELTESIAAKDSIYIADMIKKLREIGFRTSIDDFGVGYSSFSSLKRIPFNTLKIDKTFIDDIEVNERSRAMVKMVIDLGHSLEMEVVAEGVESEKQVRLLQAMKLDNIQGYFYARALSGFDYLRFLEKHPYLNYDAKGKESRKS